MPTILIAVPFGQAVRDCLQSEIFPILRDTADVRLVIVSQAAAEKAFLKAFAAPNVHFELLSDYKPSTAEHLLQTFYLATLRHKSNTILQFSRGGSQRRRLRWIAPWADFARHLCPETSIWAAVQWITKHFFRPNQYADIFERYQPDLVVVTRVFSFSADYGVLKQAAHKHVPVAAMASSWDNFTSKGFFPFGINALVVWNHVMRDEAIDLFRFPVERIFISGIPRFDRYFRREGIRAREQFFAANGFDPGRKLITYATGAWDAMLSPYDRSSPEPVIANLLANAVQNGAFGVPAQLLIRLHPQAKPADFREFLGQPFVSVHAPGLPSVFRDRILSPEDEMGLAETMQHSDVVVNIASTITIDAAVFDTPVVCVGFDVRGQRRYQDSVRRFYDFDHYRKLAETGGFRKAASKEELIQEVAMYLCNAERDQEGRRRIVEQQCCFQDGKAGARVAEHILSILRKTSVVKR